MFGKFENIWPLSPRIHTFTQTYTFSIFIVWCDAIFSNGIYFLFFSDKKVAFKFPFYLENITSFIHLQHEHFVIASQQKFWLFFFSQNKNNIKISTFLLSLLPSSFLFVCLMLSVFIIFNLEISIDGECVMVFIYTKIALIGNLSSITEWLEVLQFNWLHHYTKSFCDFSINGLVTILQTYTWYTYIYFLIHAF